MPDDASPRSEPESGSYALWYWIVVLMFLFMGIVIVMAIIQTQAQ